MRQDFIGGNIVDKFEVGRCDAPDKIGGKSQYNPSRVCFASIGKIRYAKTTMLLYLPRSTHHIRRRGAGDIDLLFVMQLHAGDRDLIPGA